MFILIDCIECPSLKMKKEIEWKERENCSNCYQIFSKLSGIFKHHWFILL